MKSFVIYVKGHADSERYMNTCLASCDNSGFDAEPFEGVTMHTLDIWSQYLYPDLPNGRITGMKKESDRLYLTKKACFTNHVRLWHKCIELNEPIAVLEQDVYCINGWNNQPFDEVLILNITSSFKQAVFQHVANKPNFDGQLGLHVYKDTFLKYTKDNLFNGAYMMPGTGSYAITPTGAKKLLGALEQNGWEQSDYFINTKSVKIEYCIPEYFTFKLKNLNMSHGL